MSLLYRLYLAIFSRAKTYKGNLLRKFFTRNLNFWAFDRACLLGFKSNWDRAGFGLTFLGPKCRPVYNSDI